MPSIPILFHTIRFWLLSFFLTFVLSLLAVFVRLFDSTGNLSHQVSSLWCRLLCEWNGVDVEVEGMEFVDRDRPQIFLANHQGYFDIFALSGYLPVQIRWVSKASLFKVPFLGWAMRASGYVSVEREDRKHSYKAFLESLEKVKSGASIIIFPEGTRSSDGKIGEFKKGSGLLAARSGAPAIPTAIIGAYDIIQKGSAWIKPGKVKIILSPPIQMNPKSKDKGEGELENIRDIICENFSRNSN